MRTREERELDYHPGQDIQWNLTDSLNILSKFEKMYDLRVRSFAVFFDDISGEGARPEKQAGLLNYIHKELSLIHIFLGETPSTLRGLPEVPVKGIEN